MQTLRHSLFAGIVIVLTTGMPARADSPPSPLRLVPEQADLVVQVPQPRQLIEFYTTHPMAKELYALQPVQEFYDSTNMRRFNQLMAYFEKQVGSRWPEMLDKVAGGGIAGASKLGAGNNGPALLVVQGTDEAAVRKFVQIGLEILEAEMAREEAKEKLRKEKYRNYETYHIGKDFHAACVGSAILISNKDEVLHKSLDLAADGPEKSLLPSREVAEARKLLPQDPLAWMWINLAEAHKSAQGKEIFATPRNDANLTILFGGMLDMVGRSPYVCAALARDKEDVFLTVRMPRGREGMPAGLSIHVPPAGQPGSLPPLQPRSCLFSTSYYFDLKAVWNDRAKLFNAKQVTAFEDFDKRSAVFLLGNRFSKLVEKVGPYHRVVVVNQPTASYKKQPDQHIPAFALVLSLREPEQFGKSVNGLLRAAGLLASTQVKLKMEEIKHGDVTIVGYRFSEDEPLKGDDGYLRYNYSPAFVQVGDQFVLSSTIDLAKELVDLLKNESRPWTAEQGKKLETARAERERLHKLLDELVQQIRTTTDDAAGDASADKIKELAREYRRCVKAVETLEKQKVQGGGQAQAGSPAKEVSRFYADGAVDALLVNEDQLIAQTILNQALTPEEAKKQVGVFINLVRRLGAVETSTHYGDKDYRIDVRLQLKK